MATKKAGSAANKTTRSKSQSTSTTVVKAVAADKPASSQSKLRLNLAYKKTVLASALIAEFIGVFLMTVVYLISRGEPLYMGFALVGVILLIGTLSGAHLNPIVTIGAWVTKKLDHVKALGYIVAQLVGAGAAYVVVDSFLGGAAQQASAAAAQAAPSVYTITALNDHTQWYAFFAELLGATVFAFAFAGVVKEKVTGAARALQLGFGLFVAMLVSGILLSYVGANIVLNPAIALAANLSDLSAVTWFTAAAYAAAPVIGGVVGFALRDALTVK